MPAMLAWTLSALAFAVAMSATPGPNNAMLAASGANFGFARTLPHMLGVAIGFPVMLLVVAAGGADLLQRALAVQQGLRWAGAAYLLWLALRIATASPVMDGAPPAASRPLSFVQGALFQWINPKGWMIAISAALTFTAPADAAPAAPLPRAIGLAAIFLVTTLPAIAFWTMTGVGARRLLRTPRAVRAFNGVMAVLLIASLVALLREP